MSRPLATILLFALAASARADPQPSEADREAAAARHHFEVDVFGGYGQLAWPGFDSSTARWSNGGAAFAVSGAYRGPHFTHPFLDLAYVPFVSSGQDVYRADTGASIYTTASTHAFAATFGPGFDVSRFRLRAGVGVYIVTTSTTAEGTSSSASSAHLGYLLSAAALVWDREPFAAGVEARLFALNSPGQGIYQTSWAVGLTGRWDFLHE